MRPDQLVAGPPTVGSLVRDLERAAPRVEELRGAATDAAAGELATMVQGLSEALRDLGASIGLDDPRSWRLLQVRDALDSHGLAAEVLASGGARADLVVRVLGRGLAEACAALVPAGP